MSNMDREQLEAIADDESKLDQKKSYVPRPKWQLALAWIAAAIVAFAFAGTIYWMVTFVP